MKPFLVTHDERQRLSAFHSFQIFTHTLYVLTYLPLLKKQIVTSKFLGVRYSEAFLFISPCLQGLNFFVLFVADNTNVSVSSCCCAFFLRSQKIFMKVPRNFFDNRQQIRKLKGALHIMSRLKKLPKTIEIKIKISNFL